MKKEIYVKNLEKRELAAIVSRRSAQTGGASRVLVEENRNLRGHSAPLGLLVAEIDNRVVGFVLGRAGEFEFGLPGTVAWIEIIGVDPAYRRQGIAQELVGQFAESAEDHGIKTIFTLVSNSQNEMQHFFSRLGFVHGKMLHYQKELAG